MRNKVMQVLKIFLGSNGPQENKTRNLFLLHHTMPGRIWMFCPPRNFSAAPPHPGNDLGAVRAGAQTTIKTNAMICVYIYAIK